MVGAGGGRPTHARFASPIDRFDGDWTGFEFRLMRYDHLVPVHGKGAVVFCAHP